MAKHERSIRFAAAIIERHDNHILIALPAERDVTERGRRWQFPRGRTQASESPEAGMRRIAKEQLGIDVEIVVGQPPLVFEDGDTAVELRYFFVGIAAGEVRRGPYRQVRWVHRARLCEYDFDPPSKPVADWLVESARR